MRLYENAYAKINLTLDVLDRRADGYHNLRSVMQTIGLSDALILETGPVWEIVSDCPGLPLDGSNLALRAAKAYMQAAGLPDALTVRIDKRIPMQAGLGGGSADAAAVLRALQKQYQALSGDALLALAERIGSDVPFCLYGGTRLCEGRGERMTVLPNLPECHIVLAYPDFASSTPHLYAALDAHPECRAPGAAEAEARLQNGQLPCGGETNRFAPLLAEAHPILTEMERMLRKAGACLTALSGTGSAYFGLFREEPPAAEAEKHLLEVCRTVYRCRPIGPLMP